MSVYERRPSIKTGKRRFLASIGLPVPVTHTVRDPTTTGRTAPHGFGVAEGSRPAAVRVGDRSPVRWTDDWSCLHPPRKRGWLPPHKVGTVSIYVLLLLQRITAGTDPCTRVNDGVLNVGDRYVLRCGHPGRVVWITEDGATIAVRGAHRPRCPVCCRDRQTRNVHLLPRDRGGRSGSDA